MSSPAVIGLDIAKNVFQVHGADAEGRCVLRRRLRRAEIVVFFARLPRALVGIEACPGGHHWARGLQRLGHDVRLIPPQYVRPFVKTNKNDAADAEGICEAVVRPNMRFVPIKSIEQQAAMMLHRTRALLLRQRTQLINAVRGHLAEFGLVARRGARNIRESAGLVHDTEPSALPDAARAMLILLLEQIREAQVRIRQTEAALEALGKEVGCLPAPDVDTGGRYNVGNGAGSHELRSQALSLGPSFCRLAWPRAEAKFERRSSSPQRHQQARRQLCSNAVDPRCALAHQMEAQELAMAGRAANAAADQRRGCCDCEQDSAHGMGNLGPWPSISAGKKGGSRIG